MNSDSQLPAIPPTPPSWEKRFLEVREEEWQAHKDCIDAARECLRRYKSGPSRAITVAEIVKLLELGSKLGRLAAGAEAHDETLTVDADYLAGLRKQLDSVFAEPIGVDSETVTETPATLEP
jgi:hypothetical protein